MFSSCYARPRSSDLLQHIGGTHYFIFDQAKAILRNDGFVSCQEFLDSFAEPGKTYLDNMKEGSDEADSWNPIPYISSGDHFMSPLDHVGLYYFPFGQFKSAASLCQEKFDEAKAHWITENFSEACRIETDKSQDKLSKPTQMSSLPELSPSCHRNRIPRVSRADYMNFSYKPMA